MSLHRMRSTIIASAASSLRTEARRHEAAARSSPKPDVVAMNRLRTTSVGPAVCDFVRAVVASVRILQPVGTHGLSQPFQRHSSSWEWFHGSVHGREAAHVYARRTAGCHRDHRRARCAAAARHSSGARGGAAFAMPEQPPAAGAGDTDASRRPPGVSSRRRQRRRLAVDVLHPALYRRSQCCLRG